MLFLGQRVFERRVAGLAWELQHHSLSPSFVVSCGFEMSKQESFDFSMPHIKFFQLNCQKSLVAASFLDKELLVAQPFISIVSRRAQKGQGSRTDGFHHDRSFLEQWHPDGKAIS